MTGKWRGFAITGIVLAASLAALIVSACSSDSNDAPNDAGIADVLFPQACTSPIQIGAGDPSTNTHAGGACGASQAHVVCTYQAPCVFDDVTIYTCTCDGTSWSCSITGDVEGGSCDAGSSNDADANEATTFDASDVVDADAS